MTRDLHIRDSADLAQLPPHFDVSTWNVGRSGELAPGLEVWTTWLPVKGVYETLVTGANTEDWPTLVALGGFTNNRNDAHAMHALVVRHVQRVVALAEAG